MVDIVLIAVVAFIIWMEVYVRRRNARFHIERVARWEAFQEKQGTRKS